MEESDIVLGLLSGIAQLKAVDTTDVNTIPNFVRVYVEGVGEYIFKRDNTSAESSPNIIQPTTGTGRWVLVSTHNLNNQLRIVAKSASDITTINNNLTEHTHSNATTTTAGFMSSGDKTKLNGIATNANNYSHPTGDGNLHVPVTSTTNNLKVLKAGATAGSIAWGSVAYSELTSIPSTFAPSAHTHPTTDITGLDTALSNKEDKANKGAANGYASLDSSAKVPLNQLPDSILGQVEYKGTYNASTNTPTLPTASTVKGHYYVVSVAGTQQSISFAVGDWVISNGTTWEKVDNTDSVTTVHGRNGAVVSANGDYTASQVTNVAAGNISSTNVQDAINELDNEKAPVVHSHSDATTSVAGFMSTADKTKLDGIATSANNYVHPTGDGNLHVPATSTINNLKVLKAGATAGSIAWGTVSYSELSNIPTTFTPSAHSHVMTDITGLSDALSGKANTSHTHLWADITDKPSTYAPSAHAHAMSDITNLEITLSGKANTNHVHSDATSSTSGFMSSGDKTKLDGVATNANNYSHPTGDGNLHVPATGTTNNNKVLKAGATVGTIAWSTIAYSELTGIPTTFAPSAHTHLWADITDKPTTFTPSTHTHVWADITDKPTTFTPSAHSHAIGDVTGLSTALSGKSDTNHVHDVATTSVAGFMSSGDKTKLDGVATNANNYSHPTGDGNLHVPATSTTNNLKVLKAGATAGTIAWGSVAYGELTGVPTTFTPSAHTHVWADITDKPTTFTPSAHSHAISDVTNLSTTLTGKEDTANKGVANGYASLDSSAKVPVSQLPDTVLGQVEYKGTWNASTNSPTLPATPTQKGEYYVVSTAGTRFSISFEVGDWIISNGTSWEKVDNSDSVTSVHGRVGAVVSANGDYTASQITNVPAGSIEAITVQAAINELDTEKAAVGHTHSNATTSVAGFMSSTDKTKLDGVATNANNYSHPTGDGNLHVPATSTTNNLKVLKAGATAGSIAWGNVAYGELTGVPTTFAPSAHSHAIDDVTGLQTALNAKSNTDHVHAVATISVAGFMSTTDKTKLDGIAANANNYVHPSGDGSLHVPATSTTNNLKVLKAGATAGSIAWGSVAYSELSGIPTTFAPSAHSHAISDVTGLQTTLEGKANAAHTHLWVDITDKPTTFTPSAHVHAIADVTNLQDTLNGKASTTHTHSDATISVSGFMSSTDKSKLDGIDTNANNYSHPTGDGNLHVPATSTTNNLKVLKAGATAGSIAWGSVAYSELTGVPTTFTPSAHNHAMTDITGLTDALNGKEAAFTTLGITKGGTGLVTTPTNGQLLIGNGTGFTLATLTQGSNISITNAAGSITIANTYSYSHPTGDGNLHVPATGTTNNLKVLKAGSTAGSLSWGSVAYTELSGVPSTFAPSAHTHSVADLTNIYISDATVKGLLENVDNWTETTYSGATAAGIQGQKHYDVVYFYECVATNSWIRMQRI